MIQFRGSNWGEALGRGIDTGMKIGGAVKQSMAESDYNSAIEKADADFDAASKAAEELKAAGDEKGYQSAMDTARRNQRYGRQQALAGYHKGMGNIGEADAANLKLEQMKFSDDFWGGIAKNSASLDKQMAERLSSDFFAQANGISYSLNDKNQLVTMQNGKPLGNPITITDEMRMPYLQKMYATEFDKRFGGAPTDASRSAWDTKSTALGKAIESNRKLDIEERKLDSYDRRTAIYAASRNSKDDVGEKYETDEGTGDQRVTNKKTGEEHGTLTYVDGTDGHPEQVFIPTGFAKDKFLKLRQQFNDLGDGHKIVSAYDKNGNRIAGVMIPGSDRIYSISDAPRIYKDALAAKTKRDAEAKEKERDAKKARINEEHPLLKIQKAKHEEHKEAVEKANPRPTALGGGR